MDNLIELLDYNKDSGIFKWKIDISNKKKGDIAGTNSNGYVVISVNKKKHYAHRLAWYFIYGTFPKGHIDHINHNKKDNRIDNLRDVSRSCNQKNRSLNNNNISGKIGVCWHKKNAKWQSQIMINGKNKALGYFDILDDAIEARINAEKEYKFHKNHGK